MKANPQFTSRAIKRTLKEFKHHDYESECVSSLSFVPESQETGLLTVIFQKRGTYIYHEFPVEEWLLFNNASSRGVFFNLYVRDHGYDYERVA